MKTEDRIARDEAEVLRAVRAMIARGMAPDIAARVVAMTVHNNDLLNDISWISTK